MKFYEISLEQRLMNTTFALTVSVPDSRLAAAEAELMHALHLGAALEDELSEFRSGTPVARLNAARAEEAVPAGPRVAELWFIAAELKISSGGAFDPLCKSARPGGLTVDEAGHVRKSTDDTKLSFGAIGKGYALDLIADRLDAAGFTDYLLSAGGSSVVMRGVAADGAAWPWGWAFEKKNDENFGRTFAHAGPRIAIGISGQQEQGAHIVKPGATAFVPPVKSALVAHASAAVADALSTALFVSGWDHFSEAPAGKDPKVVRAVASSAHELRWNGGFQNLWGAPC